MALLLSALKAKAIASENWDLCRLVTSFLDIEQEPVQSSLDVLNKHELAWDEISGRGVNLEDKILSMVLLRALKLSNNELRNIFSNIGRDLPYSAVKA